MTVVDPNFYTFLSFKKGGCSANYGGKLVIWLFIAKLLTQNAL